MQNRDYTSTIMTRISGLNYKDFEIVRTPIVVIKGSLKLNENVDCSCQEISLKAYIKCQSHDQCDQIREIRTKTVKLNFSVLAELNSGHNEINFEICHGKGTACICGNLTDQNHVWEHQLNLIYEPNSNDIFVHPLLVYCPDDNGHDHGQGVPVADTDMEIRKISVAIQLVQTYYSDQFAQFSLPRKSFTYIRESGSAKIPVLFELKTRKEKLTEMTTEEVWRLLAKELMMRPTVWRENCKYVAFILSPWKNCLGMAKPELSSRACDLALGTGGLAIMPLSFTATWPESILEVFTTTDNISPMNDIHFKFFGTNTTVGKIYSATLGCLAHEIGHIFDLGHTTRGIMGQDYHNFSLSLYPQKTPDKMISNFSSQSGTKRPSPFEQGDTLEVPTFGRSSAVLLSFHKGFRPEPKSLSSNKRLEFKSNVVQSSIGLSVLELRDPCSGLVLNGWTYETGNKVFKFPVTKKEIPTTFTSQELQIVATDLEGNILKTTVNIGSIPLTSFTKFRQ